MPIRVLFAVLVLSLSTALPAAASRSRSTDGSPAFVDLEDYLDGEARSRWWAARRSLEDEFRDVCGDTFCEGEYANIEPLSLRCSVESATGRLHGCTWVFAGSEESIHPRTGVIEVKSRTFRCLLPVTGAASELIEALAAERAAGGEGTLRRPLPSLETSAYDALLRCL